MTIDFVRVARSLELIPGHDYVLFGDGSGTSIDKPAAWGCFCVSSGGEVTRHHGSLMHGTNNLVELTGFVFALGYLNSLPSSKAVRQVAIVSDSELTVKCGRREYERHANAPMWAAIEWFERNGFQLHWRHVRRNSNSVNEECDRVAGLLRRAIGVSDL